MLSKLIKYTSKTLEILLYSLNMHLYATSQTIYFALNPLHSLNKISTKSFSQSYITQKQSKNYVKYLSSVIYIHSSYYTFMINYSQ